jgi:OPT family small oligopeptide transporter
VLSYGLQFAALTALVTHTACWHGRDIIRQWKKAIQGPSSRRNEYSPILEASGTTRQRHTTRHYLKHSRRRLSSVSETEWNEIVNGDDIHQRLMRRYQECPTSWYFATFVSMTAVGIFVVEYYPVHLPWMGLLLALAICGVFFVPVGIVMAITNTQSSLFLICQLICGTVFPGRPVANMVFVTYGYITSTQGLKFAADMKLGHYMKIPPRLLFTVQMVATVVGCLTQIGVLNWMFTNIPGICTPEAVNGFTCPIARVHFNGSILWGVVGPSRFFGKEELYRPLMYAFAVGAIGPIVIFAIWHYRGRSRSSPLKLVSLPVLFGSLSWIPPATGLNFSAWAVVCYIFNRRLRIMKPAWWAKYTMTLSAALDAGLAAALTVVFFSLVYPAWDWVVGPSLQNWWGARVFKEGCDWRACAFSNVSKGGKFGPPEGSW